MYRQSLFLLLCLLFLKPFLESKLNHYPSTRPALKPLQSSTQALSLKKFSFGFENLLAASLWVDLLQKASHKKLEEGWVSWEYAMLESITTLDRPFYQAYKFGSAFLSVFRRDRFGAKLILEKMSRQFHDIWRPHYLLSFHLYSELNDYPAAAKEMVIASRMPGAPPHLAALGVRLLSEGGALKQALATAIELHKTMHDPEAKERLEMRIRSVRYHLEELAWKEAVQTYYQTLKRWPSSIDELKKYLPEDSPSQLFQFVWDTELKKIRPAKNYSIEKLGIHRRKES